MGESKMSAPMISRLCHVLRRKTLNSASNSDKIYIFARCYKGTCHIHTVASTSKERHVFSREKLSSKAVKSTHLLSNSTSGLDQRRQIHTSRGLLSVVLGIESSCDDTGAAVVDEEGNILGEALHSQSKLHVEMGGIFPPIAANLHKENIERVVQEALDNANVQLEDLDAIAATVKPGMPQSLKVGLTHAKKLVRASGKPFIPIHHMEAHALTARLMYLVEFPYLVLLMSGGHCQLAVVRGVDDFLLLGKSLDDSPGIAYDKTARALKLKNLPECYDLCMGASVEHVAKKGDPLAFELRNVMIQIADCNFSFGGIRETSKRIIKEEEEKHGILGGTVLPNAADICAAFQLSVLNHLAKRLQRAIMYCELQGLLPDVPATRHVVLSGGVASNQYLRAGLAKVCAEYDCELVCPPMPLCTDNGIMIAWNGVERLRLGIGIAPDPEAVEIQQRCPLGEDISEDVLKSHIKPKKIKLL